MEALVVVSPEWPMRLPGPIFSYRQPTELAAMIAPWKGLLPLTQVASLDDAVALAEQTLSEKAVRFVAFPGTPFAGPRHYVVFMKGKTPLTEKLIQPALIDAEIGRLTDTREMPAYVSALLLSQPLHFGDYGGAPLKIVWVLLDVIIICVLGSGIYLWRKKRHNSVQVLLTESGEEDPIVSRMFAPNVTQ